MSSRVIARSQVPALSRTVVLIVLFAALVAVAGASWLRVPLPGNPLPVTMQVVVVLLAGAVLSPAAAASSMALFLTAGLAGLPVFVGGTSGPAHILGPSGGYL